MKKTKQNKTKQKNNQKMYLFIYDKMSTFNASFYFFVKLSSG